MKVELQCSNKITIPEGWKAIVKDGSVVFEKEEKAESQKFKDGDILTYIDGGLIAIFKKYIGSFSFQTHYTSNALYDRYFIDSTFRHSTEKEKQQLFDKMKEQGLQWNAEEKRVEKIRWSPKVGEFYYFITESGIIGSAKNREDLVYISNDIYNSFNLFRTYEQAEEAKNRIKETLKNYHNEIGE